MGTLPAGQRAWPGSSRSPQCHPLLVAPAVVTSLSRHPVLPTSTSGLGSRKHFAFSLEPLPLAHVCLLHNQLCARPPQPGTPGRPA